MSLFSDNIVKGNSFHENTVSAVKGEIIFWVLLIFFCKIIHPSLLGIILKCILKYLTDTHAFLTR